MARYDIDSTGINELFKDVYGPLSENLMNSNNVLLSRVRKKDDFTGKRIVEAVPLSFGGSVGSGTLPVANFKKYDDVLITRSKVYGRMEIDRETIYASKDDKGAFVRVMSEAVENTVESFARNMNRMMLRGSTGRLGVIDTGGVTDNGGGEYDVVITAATFHEADFEEKDYVNVESGNTDLFEVTDVVASTRVVTLQRISGSQVPVDADEIFMQGSENNDLKGLEEVVGGALGTHYGISTTTERRWQGGLLDASGAAISVDIINSEVLKIHKKTGKYPNLILVSYDQYIKLQNTLEDLKYVGVPFGGQALSGLMGFRALEVMTGGGPIPVVIDRFVRDADMWLLNTNMLEIRRAPGFGWFQDDGDVLLRLTDVDAYEARYGGYLQFYIKPPYHTRITDLA